MFDNNEDKEYKEYVDEYSYLKIGRPNRDTVISKDEILNLKISLQTDEGIRNFLNSQK